MKIKIKSTAQLVAVLQKEKEKQNKTNYRVAKEANLAESTLKRIFERKINPKFETILKIAKALDIFLFVNEAVFLDTVCPRVEENLD